MSEQQQGQQPQQKQAQKKTKPGKFEFDPLTFATDEKLDGKFVNQMNRFLVILGGRNGLKKAKVKNALLDGVIKEMFEEDQKLASEKLKAEIRTFLNDYSTYVVETKKSFSAFVAAVKKNKEELIQRANNLATNIENADALLKERVGSLGVFAGSGSTDDDEVINNDAQPGAEATE